MNSSAEREDWSRECLSWIEVVTKKVLCAAAIWDGAMWRFGIDIIRIINTRPLDSARLLASQRSTVPLWNAQRLKAQSWAAFSARLKACPDTTPAILLNVTK